MLLGYHAALIFSSRIIGCNWWRLSSPVITNNGMSPPRLPCVQDWIKNLCGRKQGSRKSILFAKFTRWGWVKARASAHAYHAAPRASIFPEPFQALAGNIHWYSSNQLSGLTYSFHMQWDTCSRLGLRSLRGSLFVGLLCGQCLKNTSTLVLLVYAKRLCKRKT